MPFYNREREIKEVKAVLRDESFWKKLIKKVDLISAVLEYAEKLIEKINYQLEVPTRVIEAFLRR